MPPPRHPTEPNPAAALTAAQYDLIDLPQLEVDLSSSLAPWDTNDVVLAKKIREEDGVVAIGFKEPSARRTIQTGIREALTAATFASGLNAVEELGGELLYVRKHLGSVHARIPPEAASDLRKHELVDYIEPRLWGQLAGTPARSTAAALATMEGCDPNTQECLTWGVEWVNARDAHLQGSGGFGGRVLIIDTGHDRGHEDLPLVWTNHCGGAYDGCTDFSDRPHGTFVMGTLVARDNDVGIIGTAPLVIASQVYVWGACDQNDFCDYTEVADGLDAAIHWDVQVVNMSLSDDTGTLDWATGVAAAQDADILIVAAAGNLSEEDPQPRLVYPAAYEGVIGVSGIKGDSTFAAAGQTEFCANELFPERAPYSNQGPHVDLTSAFYAMSTVKYNGYEDFDDPLPLGAAWCGTSMATPHVAGVAALIRAKYPDLCQGQVAQILFDTAVDLGPTTGRDDEYGWGLPDAVAALALADATAPCEPPPPAELDVSISGPAEIQPEATCTWEAVVEPPSDDYTYDWYNDGIHVGTGRYYTGGKDPASLRDWFTLEVAVGGIGTGSATLTVYESESAPVCLM